MAKRFTAVLQAEGTGTFVEVPPDVIEALGDRKRVPVRGTLQGTPFRTTIAVYGGRFYVGVNRALRTAARVELGDRITVVLERDDEPRVVNVPQDLAAALKRDAKARSAWAQLAFSHQREYVGAILDAKRDDTRQRRVQSAIDMLRKRAERRESAK